MFKTGNTGHMQICTVFFSYKKVPNSHERNQYGIINGSRRKRIAAGSGTRIQDVNRLLKNYAQVMKMMKKINKGGMRGLGRGMMPF